MGACAWERCPAVWEFYFEMNLSPAVFLHANEQMTIFFLNAGVVTYLDVPPALCLSRYSSGCCTASKPALNVSAHTCCDDTVWLNWILGSSSPTISHFNISCCYFFNLSLGLSSEHLSDFRFLSSLQLPAMVSGGDGWNFCLCLIFCFREVPWHLLCEMNTESIPSMCVHRKELCPGTASWLMHRKLQTFSEKINSSLEDRWQIFT